MENKNFHNGYEYVDLGLPSGTLWATKNVGEDELTHFTFDEAKNSSKFTVNIWNAKWKTPTKAQFEELFANTTSAWVEKYHGGCFNGMLLTSKINGKEIFFPAHGFIDSLVVGHIRFFNTRCNYWAIENTKHTENNHTECVEKPFAIFMMDGHQDIKDGENDADYGLRFSVRAVVNKAELFRKDAREIADKVKHLKGDIAIFSDKYKLDKRNIINIVKILNNSES